MFSPNWCRQPMCHNPRMNADKKATRVQPAAEQVDLAVEVFAMLAESTRVGLLWALLTVSWQSTSWPRRSASLPLRCRSIWPSCG